MSVVFDEMILAILETRRDFSRQRKPRFDFKAGHRINRTLKNRIGKSRVLPKPRSVSLEIRFVVQNFDRVNSMRFRATEKVWRLFLQD